MEALKGRFEQRFLAVSDGRRTRSDVRGIGEWLASRPSLKWDGVTVFPETVAKLEGPEGLGGTSEAGDDTIARAEESFRKELNVLAEAWAMLTVREWTQSVEIDSLKEEIEKLRQHYESVEEPKFDGIDEKELFTNGPRCVEAVLSWLEGKHCSPQRFLPHLSSSASGGRRDLRALDRLLGRRLAEFRMCLSELGECYNLRFPLPGEDSVLKGLERLVGRLREAGIEAPISVVALREAARKRGDELLDGVCAKNFNPGRINSHLLFRSAA